MEMDYDDVMGLVQRINEHKSVESGAPCMRKLNDEQRDMIQRYKQQHEK